MPGRLSHPNGFQTLFQSPYAWKSAHRLMS